MTSVSPSRQSFKVTAVGDVEEGIPNLLQVDSSGRTVKEEVVVDGVTYNMTLTDTGGMEELDRLQPAVYRDTDCFLLYYFANSPTSLQSIDTKWWPEVRGVGPNVAAVLVEVQPGVREMPSELAEKLQHKLGLASSVRYRPYNLEPVLVEAVRAIKKHIPKQQRVKSESLFVDDNTEQSSSCCSCFSSCFKSKDSSYSFQ